MICQIYVDNITFGSANSSVCQEFSELMQEKFEMSLMQELKFFLGIQINQASEATYVYQSKYIKDILEKEEISQKVCQKIYRGMICSLLYLTATRPDILFSVYLCSRF
jgi:hypothetical protein